MRQPSQGRDGIWKAVQAGVTREHAWQKDVEVGPREGSGRWGSVTEDRRGRQHEAGYHRAPWAL